MNLIVIICIFLGFITLAFVDITDSNMRAGITQDLARYKLIHQVDEDLSTFAARHGYMPTPLNITHTDALGILYGTVPVEQLRSEDMTLTAGEDITYAIPVKLTIPPVNAVVVASNVAQIRLDGGVRYRWVDYMLMDNYGNTAGRIISKKDGNLVWFHNGD